MIKSVSCKIVKTKKVECCFKTIFVEVAADFDPASPLAGIVVPSDIAEEDTIGAIYNNGIALYTYTGGALVLDGFYGAPAPTTSSFLQDVLTGEITHDPGDGSTPTTAQVVSQDVDNAAEVGSDGGAFIDCNKLTEQFQLAPITEIWNGSQTSYTFPALAAGETYDFFQLLHEGVEYTENDGVTDYSVVDNRTFTVTDNGDGSFTITPDVTLGEPAYPCRVTFKATITKTYC